jgi:hypothetical protein
VFGSNNSGPYAEYCPHSRCIARQGLRKVAQFEALCLLTRGAHLVTKKVQSMSVHMYVLNPFTENTPANETLQCQCLRHVKTALNTANCNLSNSFSFSLSFCGKCELLINSATKFTCHCFNEVISSAFCSLQCSQYRSLHSSTGDEEYGWEGRRQDKQERS